MTRLLWFISDNARLCLIVGLISGLALPMIASALEPWLPLMVALMLAVTALRIGHRAVLDAMENAHLALGSVVLLQLLLPVTVFLVTSGLGVADSPFATAAILATAAPTLAGAANLALLLGQNSGRMMQIMIMGTATFPLTVLPVLALMPEFGSASEVLRATGRLLFVIVIATGVGFWIRARAFPCPSTDQIKALDGLSVLAFSAIVVGLMAAINPALRSEPGDVARWMMLAFAICYGLQILVYQGAKRGRLTDMAGPLAIGAGNRNIALFLVALPPDIIAPMMIFVGCWQIPMYLTPILMRWLYHRRD